MNADRLALSCVTRHQALVGWFVHWIDQAERQLPHDVRAYAPELAAQDFEEGSALHRGLLACRAGEGAAC